MPLFDQQTGSGDAATRALSVTVVENDFVAKVYQNLAHVYDYTFGPMLHHGRMAALKRMAIRPGDEVLEVGVGTGISFDLYPPTCSVTGIDVSSKMLDKARARIVNEGFCHCDVHEMNAEELAFADNSFDAVYAPYVISVVPDPGEGRAGDVPRVPAGRPRRHPQPFPQLEFARFRHRARDFTDDGSPRLQGRPRSAGLPRAGESRSRVDREGQRAKIWTLVTVVKPHVDHAIASSPKH